MFYYILNYRKQKGTNMFVEKNRGEYLKVDMINGFEIVHDLIKLKWIPEILKSIHCGNQRYSEILGSISYMSHTELNRKLAILVEKHVIDKDTLENKYILKNFGKDLVHIFYHLEDLEEKYFQSS